MHDRKIFVPSNIILFLIAAIVFSVSIFVAISLHIDELQKKIGEKNPVSFIFNISDEGKVLFSEIVIYHPEKCRLAVVDFPVEYGSVIKSISRMDRVDAIYKSGRPLQYVKKIEKECGMEISHYLELNLDDLRRFVDLMGGLDTVVGTPVELCDSSGGAILLPDGRCRFDGEKAVQYVRSFDQIVSESELASMRQRLVLEIIRSIGTNEAYLRNGDAFRILCDCIETSLSSDALGTFVAVMASADTEHVLFQRVLGDRKVIDGKVLLFPYYDGKLLRESLSQTLELLETGDITDIASFDVSIDILNGTDINGLANRVSIGYKNYGYKVRSVGNADGSDIERTVIVGHRDQLRALEQVAKVIRCKNILSDGDTEGCITIILGKDFDGRYCK